VAVTEQPSDPAPRTAPDPAGGPGGAAADPIHDARQAAILCSVRELELHVSASGWDGPWRLFALIRTADAMDRDPALAAQLPADVVVAARQDAEHLTAVEQEDLPQSHTLEALLSTIVWPDTVDGAALVVERVVLPPEVEADLPADPAEAVEWLAAHPARRELRLAAAVLRAARPQSTQPQPAAGPNGCAVRARDHDDDLRVAVAPDLVPGLVSGLAATLQG
jgi:hypothetical protein